MPLEIYRRHVRDCPGNARCRCIWWVRGRVAGAPRPLRESLHTRSRELAAWLAAQRELGQGRGEHPMRWSEFAPRFAANYRGTTRVRIEQLLRRLAAHFRDGHLHQVSSVELEAYLHSRRLAPSSARHELAQLRTLFAHAARHRIVSANPATAIVPPPAPPAARRPFSQAELAALERAIARLDRLPSLAGRELGARLHAMYLVLLTTGLRVSDLLRLRPEQVRDGHIVLAQYKSSRPCAIPLLPATAAALARVRPTAAGFYFWTGRGSMKGAGSTAWRAFRRLGKRAGVADPHPHRFRHTFAVRLLAAGTPLHLVSKLLGHTSTRTTEKHYWPWVKEFQQQADSAVTRAFAPTMGRPPLSAGTKSVQGVRPPARMRIRRNIYAARRGGK